MSSDDETSAPEERPESAALFPLLDDDPAKVGEAQFRDAIEGVGFDVI